MQVLAIWWSILFKKEKGRCATGTFLAFCEPMGGGHSMIFDCNFDHHSTASRKISLLTSETENMIFPL